MNAEQAVALKQSGFDIEPGEYLALLSHSGSRGAGAQVCQHYSRIAMDRRNEQPKELKHLAWLSFDEEAAQEYWAAMNLMGRSEMATVRSSARRLPGVRQSRRGCLCVFPISAVLPL